MDRREFLLGIGVAGIGGITTLPRKSEAQIIIPTVAELLRERGIAHELSYHPGLNGVLVTQIIWDDNIYELLSFAIWRDRFVFPLGRGITAETVHVPYGAELIIYSRGKFAFSLAL